MRTSLLISAAIAFSISWPFIQAQDAPAPLSWTNNAGVAIQGIFVRLAGESVIILKDGKEIPIPLAKLSLESRQQARKLGAVAPGRADPAAAALVAMPDDPAVPSEGAWKKNISTGFPKQGKDRLFLLNRGWIEGQLVSTDPSSVTFAVAGKTLLFPRGEVSLIGLTDWLNPAKRTSDKEIRLRVVMEGAAERAMLHFSNGAVIKAVDKEPKWEEGGDSKDKAHTDGTSVSFDKGNDKSVTRLACEVTLRLPCDGPLAFEIENNRSNNYSGPLALKFVEPESSREIARVEPPEGDEGRMWRSYEIPRERLLKASASLKLESLVPKFERGKIKSLALTGIQAARPTPGAARLIFVNEPARAVLIDSINADAIRLNDPQHTLVPRSKIAWIELLDWQLSGPAAVPSPAETPPLRFSAFGISTSNSITLPAGAKLARLMVPPYPLYGMDRLDSFALNDERTFRCHRGNMDQSPFHAEMVATLALSQETAVDFAIANAYTNIWSGYLEMGIQQAFTGRHVLDFKSAEGELAASAKVQLSKLMSP